MPVLAAALDTWGARRETSTLPSRPHTNVGCAVVNQNDLKRIHRPCDLQGANKTCIQNLSLKNTPQQKKHQQPKKAPLQKISHLEFGLQKFFWLSFFWGLPIPSPFPRGTFTREQPLFNSQPQEVQASPLKQFVAGRRLAHHLVHVPFDKAVPANAAKNETANEWIMRTLQSIFLKTNLLLESTIHCWVSKILHNLDLLQLSLPSVHHSPWRCKTLGSSLWGCLLSKHQLKDNISIVLRAEVLRKKRLSLNDKRRTGKNLIQTNTPVRHMSCKALVHCLSYCPTKALAEHSLHFPFWWDYIGFKPTYATDPTKCLTYICIYVMCTYFISSNICILYIYIYTFFSTCCISSHFYMRAYIHLRFRMGSFLFIPCHGTSAACGSSKQASRTARPDSLMISLDKRQPSIDWLRRG